MKVKITFFFLFAFSYFVHAQLNFTQISNVPYNTNTSDIWGYTAPDGTEYALVGLGNGLSIISLADPANPVEVANIPGGQSTWRDIKTWEGYAYVTTDEPGTNDGLLIVDLTQLPDAAPFENWNPSMPDGAILNTCHNIYIDEFGTAYLSGCNSNGGGLIFLDVDTEPGSPIISGVGAPEYSHDVYVRDNLAYSAEINAGVFSVYDVTDKTNVTLEASQATPFNFTHNVWLSDDGLTLFTTDELANAPIGSYDVSDLDDIKELDQFEPFATIGEGIAPHNVHVWNDYLVISYYRNGCLLVDAARPDNLIEVGFFDSFTEPGFTFQGAWGAYPFLPSGLVLLTDISNGLFVLEPTYVRACYLEGMVTDASNAAPIFGATVEFTSELTFEETDLAGEFKTGIATAGTYDILVSKAGYESQTISVDLENGEVTALNVALVPLVPFEVNGTVVDEVTGNPIADAQVSISNADFDFNTLTDADGNYTLEIFAGEYDFFAGIWGHRTAGNLGLTITESDANLGTTELEEGYEDVFSLDLGWEVVSEAVQGNFERVFAEGYTVQGLPFSIQPDEDEANDIGNHCFLTGSSDDLMESVFIGAEGFGTTAIVSPEFDMADMNEPYVSFYTWFFSIFIPQGGGFPPPGDDVLVAKLTNGVDTVIILEQMTGDLFTPPSFVQQAVAVKDVITPTATMKLIIEIETNTEGDITEAAVDFFEAVDADPSGLNENFLENVTLNLSPNPTSGTFYIDYSLENIENEAQVVIFDVFGKAVFTNKVETQMGQIAVQENLPNGIYFVQMQTGNEVSRSVKLVVND